MFGLQNGSERKQEFTGVPGGLPEPPGDIMGLMGLSGKGGKGWPGRPRASPPFPSPSRTRRRGRRPSPSLSPSGNLVGLGLGGGGILLRRGGGGGGILLPVGVGLPWRAKLGRPAPPPCSFIYGGRGAP